MLSTQPKDFHFDQCLPCSGPGLLEVWTWMTWILSAMRVGQSHSRKLQRKKWKKCPESCKQPGAFAETIIMLEQMRKVIVGILMFWWSVESFSVVSFVQVAKFALGLLVKDISVCSRHFIGLVISFYTSQLAINQCDFWSWRWWCNINHISCPPLHPGQNGFQGGRVAREEMNCWKTWQLTPMMTCQLRWCLGRFWIIVLVWCHYIFWCQVCRHNISWVITNIYEYHDVM